MLSYLVIMLDDTSISYCHYPDSDKETRLMPIEVVKEGILFAMKYNLHIQYILPRYVLPDNYLELMASYEHDTIGPLANQEDADVAVADSLKELFDAVDSLQQDKRYIVRTSVHEFLRDWELLTSIFSKGVGVNVVYTNVENFTDDLIPEYIRILSAIASEIHSLILQGVSINTNILTDRIALEEMNNCGAGDTLITLCPDGKLYPCPGFYTRSDNRFYTAEIDSPRFNNPQLFKLSHSPICKKCDAFHCKRCVWLNKSLTCEVNVPSHEQCVMSNIERNSSAKLLSDLHANGLLKHIAISKQDHLDPFELFKN